MRAVLIKHVYTSLKTSYFYDAFTLEAQNCVKLTKD